MTESEVRAALRTMMPERTASEISALAADEGAKIAFSGTVANPPPLPADMTAANFTALRDWILDGKPGPELTKLFQRARLELDAGNQGRFLLAVLLLFKTVRSQLRHLDP